MENNHLAAQAATQNKLTPKTIEARWTPILIKAGGFTPISIYFLENYHRLAQHPTHAEVVLIIQLMRHKFDARAPFPGFKMLAKRMGVSATAVRNHARSLEAKGFLKRELREAQTNKFHLEPLFEALEKLIKEDAGRAQTAVARETRREMIEEGLAAAQA